MNTRIDSVHDAIRIQKETGGKIYRYLPTFNRFKAHYVVSLDVPKNRRGSKIQVMESIDRWRDIKL
jgi:hypothetical protein